MQVIWLHLDIFPLWFLVFVLLEVPITTKFFSYSLLSLLFIIFSIHIVFEFRCSIFVPIYVNLCKMYSISLISLLIQLLEFGWYEFRTVNSGEGLLFSSSWCHDHSPGSIKEIQVDDLHSTVKEDLRKFI